MVPARTTGKIRARGGVAATGAGLHLALRPLVKERARMSRLRLRLSATAEEVRFARAAITRLCEHLEITDETTERVRLAVTEACTNCVLHAYEECTDPATYVLDARVEDRVLRVSVSDHGSGVREGLPGTIEGAGFGLDLIAQLADSSDVSSRRGGGTRVVMRFALPV